MKALQRLDSKISVESLVRTEQETADLFLSISNQNGISLKRYIVEIHHSGRKSSFFNHMFIVFYMWTRGEKQTLMSVSMCLTLSKPLEAMHLILAKCVWYSAAQGIKSFNKTGSQA